MKNKLLNLHKKYNEHFNCFVVGGCTTFVSLFSKYLLLFTIFISRSSFHIQLSILISWFLSVMFECVIKKKFIFNNKVKNIFKEFLVRMPTLLIDSLILWFCITLLGFDSNFYVVVWSLLSQVIIFIVNYVLNKYLVFDKKSEKIFSKKNIFYIILLIMLFILSYIFPYTHDDWAWGSSIGIERLTSLFKDYNGRWFGNFFVLLLTRNRILRSLIITGVFTGILIYINKLLDLKNNFTKLLTIVLILLMPVSVLAQAVAWTSGFTNYVIVVLLILIYLNYNKDYLINNKSKIISYKSIVLYFILGFSSSLFIEHLTIYNVLISIYFLILGKVKKKEFSKINLSYMIGGLLGAILMFSNGAYYNIANNQDSYRQIGQNNIVIDALRTYFSELSKYLFIENHFINIFVGILSLFLIYRFLIDNKKIKKIYKKLLYVISLYILTFLCLDIYYIFINNIMLVSSGMVNILNGTIYGLYWIMVLIVILFLITDKKIKFRMIFVLCSIIIMAAPLLIVKPIGPRCFFSTYIFFVIFVIDLFNYVFLREIKKIDNFSNILKYICIILLFINIFIYGVAFVVEVHRNIYINNNRDAKTLVLPEIPFDEYMQIPNPTTEIFRDRFKLFYNIDDDVSLEFVPYGFWVK